MRWQGIRKILCLFAPQRLKLNLLSAVPASEPCCSPSEREEEEVRKAKMRDSTTLILETRQVEINFFFYRDCFCLCVCDLLLCPHRLRQCCGSISEAVRPRLHGCDLDKPAQEEISPLVSLSRTESSS